MPDCVVRPYHSDAIPYLLELALATLGDSGAVRKTEDFWRWKHEVNPFGPSFGLYAWDETQQRAASLRMLLRWQFRTGDGTILAAARAVDTATHPDYQRQGLFTKLTQNLIQELAREGVDLIFNTPNRKSLPGYLKMGWRVVAQWPLYIKVLRPLGLMQSLLKRMDAGEATKWDRIFGGSVLSWPVFVERYGDQIEVLVTAWEARRGQIGLRTPRNLAYLDWRYGQHPHIAYGVYPWTTEEQPSNLAGFGVLRPNVRYGMRELVLAEMFLDPGMLDKDRQFMKGLLRSLRGDYVVAHMAKGTLEHNQLKRAGFVRVPRRGITFTTRMLQSDVADLSLPAVWDLSLGDLELF